MGLIELFILAVGLSMDAFAVSICKGLSLRKVSLKNVQRLVCTLVDSKEVCHLLDLY